MRRTIDATGLHDSTQVATDAAWRRRDIGDTIKAIDALVEFAVKAERDACSQKAREFAGHYPEGSDGRNTFIILAEWIENRAPAPTNS